MEKARPRKTKAKNKTCFTHPHIRYQDKENQMLCDELKAKYYAYLNDPLISNFNIISMLAGEYKVPRTTLVGWTKRWEKEPDWMPGNFARYAAVKRIFDDAIEKSVSDFIEDNYITPGNYLPDWGFKNIIFQAYNENDDIKRDFHCSPGFIRDFKVRNRFSSRTAHIKKRPDIKLNEDGTSDINSFINDVKKVIIEAREHDEPVLNADETGWRILPPKMKTWAKIGTSNIVINVKDSEYAHISAMCTISSDFAKLPIFFIAKGKTVLSEDNQIGDDIFPNVSTHSLKAYMTTKCFIKYLHFIRDQFPAEKKIHLIIDSYSSHIAKASQMAATRLNIHLIYIPSGYTDKYQPLDVAVFAVLKSIANKKLRDFLYNHPNVELGMKKSVETLIESWDKLPIESLHRAWEQYIQ